jgi:hypothetical protein
MEVSNIEDKKINIGPVSSFQIVSAIFRLLIIKY